MSGEVIITVHQGCDVYDECRLCGDDVTYKRGWPVLYSIQPDGPAPVCFSCAKRDDPDVAEFFERAWAGENACIGRCRRCGDWFNLASARECEEHLHVEMQAVNGASDRLKVYINPDSEWRPLFELFAADLAELAAADDSEQ